MEDVQIPKPASEEDDYVPGLYKISKQDTFGREVKSASRDALTLGIESAAPEPTIGFGESIGAAFNSGDNFARQVWKRVEREASVEPEEGFNAENYVKKFGKDVPEMYHKSLLLAGSTAEADKIKVDIHQQLKDRENLAKLGIVNQVVAGAIAGIVDLDAPLTLAAGGIGWGAKGGFLATRAGRLASGASVGGLVMGAASTLGTAASPVGDWADIPVAALAGMGFGAFGASLRRPGKPELSPTILRTEQAANDAIKKTADELSETIIEGAPFAQRDIRTETHVPSGPQAVRIDPETGNPSTIGKEWVITPEEPTAVSTRTTQGPVVGKVEPELVVAPEAKPAYKGPVVKTGQEIVADVVPELEAGDTIRDGSIGARSRPTTGGVTVTSRDQAVTIRDAQTWAQQSGVPQEYTYNNGPAAWKSTAQAVVANGARMFHDFVVATKTLATDFDRLMKSGSVVAQKAAYDFGESAAGLVRNNRSAPMIREDYSRQLAAAWRPAYLDSYEVWAKQNSNSRFGWVGREWDYAAKKRFNEEVVYELQARLYGGVPTQGIHPAVKQAADAIDTWSAKDHAIGNGRPGEIPIAGYDQFQPKSGYFPQKWSGANMMDMVRSGKTTEKQLVQTIANAYQKLHGVLPDDAKKMANAVYLRSKSMDRGADTNLMGILQGDGRAFLEQSLRNSGVSNPAEIDRIINRLTGEMQERGKLAQTKHRIDIDMRYTDPTTGVRIMDMMDTDIDVVLSRRTRSTSGAAALARKGIDSKEALQHLKDTILAEQQARGVHPNNPNASMLEKASDYIDRDLPVDRAFLDAFFGHYEGGPITGGIDPIVSRMMKLTRLATMNQLGLTQMAETGATIAAVGVKRFFEHAGSEFTSLLKKADSPLVQELKHMSLLIPEERLFHPARNLEIDRSLMAASEFTQKMDRALDLGSKIQGYTSLFFQTRLLQQRIAMTSMADKLFVGLKNGVDGFSPERLHDMGIEPAMVQKLQGYIANGTVEFEGNGLKKMHLDKWVPEDVDDMVYMLDRVSSQLVQKAMIGESSIIFHTSGVAALFAQFKSFPFLAMQKQTLRNARIMDPETVGSFTLGLMTAAAAYSAKQVINLNTDKLTPVDIAKGAFGMSNMAGWIPMWTDPVANMLGMDSLKFNEYARGIDNNVISTPASLTTLNKLSNVPGAIIDTVTGNASNSTIRAFQVTPLIGNAYGFAAIANALKD